MKEASQFSSKKQLPEAESQKRQRSPHLNEEESLRKELERLRNKSYNSKTGMALSGMLATTSSQAQRGVPLEKSVVKTLLNIAQSNWECACLEA